VIHKRINKVPASPHIACQRWHAAPIMGMGFHSTPAVDQAKMD
jgi:hypothetical protein